MVLHHIYATATGSLIFYFSRLAHGPPRASLPFRYYTDYNAFSHCRQAATRRFASSFKRGGDGCRFIYVISR